MCIGFLSGWPGVGRSIWLDLEVGGLACPRRSAIGDELRRARLRVPELELREVDAAGVLEAGDELLDRRRLAVVALEVEVHALAEAVCAEQRRDHADDLGALLVDGRRVEVVDLDVAVGPHRMRERARVLGELVASQRAHVLDALHRRERSSAENSWSR